MEYERNKQILGNHYREIIDTTKDKNNLIEYENEYKDDELDRKIRFIMEVLEQIRISIGKSSRNDINRILRNYRTTRNLHACQDLFYNLRKIYIESMEDLHSGYEYYKLITSDCTIKQENAARYTAECTTIIYQKEKIEKEFKNNKTHMNQIALKFYECTEIECTEIESSCAVMRRSIDRIDALVKTIFCDINAMRMALVNGKKRKKLRDCWCDSVNKSKND